MKASATRTLVSLLMLTICSCVDDESLFVQHHPNHESLVVSILTEGDELAIPDAQVKIYDGEQLLADFISKGSVNNFSFNGEPGKQYLLKVIKEDFETYTTTFTLAELKKKVEGVVKVRMKPILELTVEAWDENDNYSLDLDGEGLITIVWPDKSTQTLTMPFSTSMELPQEAGQKIEIKGDLRGIKSFNAFGYNTAITDISGLKHLRSLTAFFPGRLILSKELDLRHNHDLQSLDVFEATLPRFLHLPKQHALNNITLTLSDRLITTKEIDELINNIFHNSTRRRIQGGTIHLTGSETASAKAKRMISMLEEQYGWSIELNY